MELTKLDRFIGSLEIYLDRALHCQDELEQSYFGVKKDDSYILYGFNGAGISNEIVGDYLRQARKIVEEMNEECLKAFEEAKEERQGTAAIK